jgi:hypothetical protein
MGACSLLALFVLSLATSGCLSPLALDTMEATGSSAPLVIDHFGRGQGIGFCLATYDDVTAATLRAADEKRPARYHYRASFRHDDIGRVRRRLVRTEGPGATHGGPDHRLVAPLGRFPAGLGDRHRK